MVLFRFYRIVGTGTDEYIGSTKQTIQRRFCIHKALYRSFLSEKTTNCGSFGLFKIYGVENCKIELISELECESKKEARMEERRIYDERRDIIVNLNRPYVSVEENKERVKEWCQVNKDKIKDYKKEFYLDNPEYNKEWYQSNSESVLEQKKEYYIANRNKILARQREKYHANKAKSIL